MKRALVAVVPLVAIVATGFLVLRPSHTPAPANAAPTPVWEVCFTPGDNCTKAVVTALEHARRAVLVQAYTFTSAPIAKALVGAHTRGVKVEAILDKSNRSDRYSSADFLARAGIPVRIDAAHAIAHNRSRRRSSSESRASTVMAPAERPVRVDGGLRSRAPPGSQGRLGRGGRTSPTAGRPASSRRRRCRGSRCSRPGLLRSDNRLPDAPVEHVEGVQLRHEEWTPRTDTGPLKSRRLTICTGRPNSGGSSAAGSVGLGVPKQLTKA